MSEYRPKVGDRVRITYDATVKARAHFGALLTEALRVDATGQRRTPYPAWEFEDIAPVSIERAPVEELPLGSIVRASFPAAPADWSRDLIAQRAGVNERWRVTSAEDGQFHGWCDWGDLEDVEVLYATPGGQG